MSGCVNLFRENGTPFKIGQTVYVARYYSYGKITDLDSMSEQAYIVFGKITAWVDFADIKESL